jgi:hypothetical protein
MNPKHLLILIVSLVIKINIIEQGRFLEGVLLLKKRHSVITVSSAFQK